MMDAAGMEAKRVEDAPILRGGLVTPPWCPQRSPIEALALETKQAEDLVEILAARIRAQMCTEDPTRSSSHQLPCHQQGEPGVSTILHSHAHMDFSEEYPPTTNGSGMFTEPPSTYDGASDFSTQLKANETRVELSKCESEGDMRQPWAYLSDTEVRNVAETTLQGVVAPKLIERLNRRELIALITVHISQMTDRTRRESEEKVVTDDVNSSELPVEPLQRCVYDVDPQCIPQEHPHRIPKMQGTAPAMTTAPADQPSGVKTYLWDGTEAKASGRHTQARATTPRGRRKSHGPSFGH